MNFPTGHKKNALISYFNKLCKLNGWLKFLTNSRRYTTPICLTQKFCPNLQINQKIKIYIRKIATVHGQDRLTPVRRKSIDLITLYLNIAAKIYQIGKKSIYFDVEGYRKNLSRGGGLRNYRTVQKCAEFKL